MKVNKTLIIIIVAIIGLIVLINYDSTEPQTKNEVTFTQFDKDGNIIKQDSFPLKENIHLMSIEEIEQRLPNILPEAITTELNLTITNTGNIPLDIEVKQSEFILNYFE